MYNVIFFGLSYIINMISRLIVYSLILLSIIIIAFGGWKIYRYYYPKNNIISMYKSPAKTITFVSGYYELPSRASKSVYLDRMERLFRSLTGRLVFFTTTDMAEWVREKCVVNKGLNVDVRILPMSLWESKTRLPDGFWESQHALNDKERHHHSPELYQVWYQKHHFVQRVIDSDLGAGTDNYVWVDAGIVRTDNTEKLLALWETNASQHLEEDRLLIMEVKNFTKNERSNGSILDLYNDEAGYRIGAGITGGGRQAWRTWIDLYDPIMINMTDMGMFVGKDQNVWSAIALMHPQAVHTVKSYTKDDWFYLVSILSSPTIQISAHRTLQYKKLGNYGRMGNQLFQIAAVVGLSRDDNRIALLPSDWKYSHVFPNYGMDNVARYDKQSKLKLLTNVSSNINEPGNKSYEHDSQCIVGARDHANLEGYRQSDRYWEPHCTKNIHYLFKLDPVLVAKVIDSIRTQYPTLPYPHGCTAVHVRRGDYVVLHHIHGVCTTEYYREAIRGIKPSTVLFVSDDISWCKKTFGNSFCYCQIPQGGEVEDFIAIHLASRKVLSNSSFSWWAAYLGGGEVTAPTPWIKTMPSDNIQRKDWRILRGSDGKQNI